MKQVVTPRLPGWLALSAAVLLAGMQAACTYKKVTIEPSTTPCAAPTAATVRYSTDVWPILKKNCRDACHNPQDSYLYANFNMDVFAQVRSYTLTPPSPSLPYGYLIGNIRHEPGYVNMPVGAAKLSDCDIATIEAWATAGAPNN